ncbi:MAG: c-type cytochrome [Bacteriovoracaceae bacterium]|jgi:mono/diheme cytochrome c family protein|nr:c-type cytochrome [Bacteriovoracaceae bacterium]
MKVFFNLVFLLTLISCSKPTFVEDKVFAGSNQVKAHTLNEGEKIYKEYCMPCHGVKGDGKGFASKGMKVPPRDFTLGIYKFGKVISGDLPHDSDFFAILDKGLHGTAMLPWDLHNDQKDAVIQYIKTFAMKTWEGGDKKLGDQIKAENDPFGMAHLGAAIAKGREVYHVTAQCQSCHRAYVNLDDFSAMSKKLNDESVNELDDDFYKIKLQESEYGSLTIPPDFTWNTVRSAVTVEELFVRISAGVGGTAMPGWQETISDEEIWAVSYYVKSLMDLKDTPARAAFIRELK